MAVFHCRNCTHVQAVDDVHIGKSTRCPKCQQSGKVIEDDLSLDAKVAVPPVAVSDSQETPTIWRTNGGTIRTVLGHGIVLNETSSLDREWITIVDPRMPAKLVGDTGIKTKYQSESDYRAAGYFYSASYEIHAIEPLSAFQIHYLTFDLWGSHERTLVTTEIVDLTAGENRKDDAKWDLYSENEASELYASIAYVSRVRTASGKVIRADTRTVLDEAHRFNEKFMESDLEPVKVKR